MGAANSEEQTGMQYMLLIYGDEAGMATATPEQMTQMMGAYRVFTESLVSAGALVSADRLQPVANATTVRTSNGAMQLHDGPFAETKEQLGGYYLIEAADLDAALGWAKKCPGAARGSVEVRPVFAMPAG
jgi:hypothetical protein